MTTTRTNRIFRAPLGGLTLLCAVALVAQTAAATVDWKQTDDASSQAASKALNRITGLTVEEGDDGSTALRLRGSTEPTFNVYRLSDPDRVVVDISRSKRDNVVPRLPLDTWVANRVTIDEARDQGSNLVRMVVELKREASYIVVPDGDDLVVTITPREVPPERYFERKSADRRRDEIEQKKRSVQRLQNDARLLKGEAEALNKVASKRAADAQRRVEEASTRAARARRAEARAKKAEQAAAAALRQAKSGRADMRAELQRARKARRQAEQAREAAEQAVEAANARAREERSAAEQARRRAAEAEQDARRLRAQAKQTLADARAALERAEQDKKAARSKLQAAKRERKAAAATLQQAKDQRQAAAKARREAEQALNAAKTRSKRGRNRKIRQLERKLRAAEQAEQGARRKAQKAVQARRASKEALLVARAQMQAERRKVEQARKQLAADRAELERMREQTASEKRQAIAAQKQAQKARARATKIEGEAKRALAEAEQAMKQARTERESAARARRKAEQAVREAQQEAAAAKRRGEGSKAVEQALAQARQAERAARKRQHRAEEKLEQLQADRDALKRRLAKQRSVSRELEQRIVARKKRLAELEEDVEAAKARLNRSGGPASKGDLKRAQAKSRRLQAAVLVLEKEVARLRGEARQARSRAGEAEQRVKTLQQSGAEQAEISRARKTASEAKRAAEEARDRLQRHSQRLSALERDKQALEGEIGTLKRKRSALAEQGRTLERKNAKARRELARAERELEQVRQALASESERLHAVQHEVKQAHTKLEQRLAQRQPSVEQRWKRQRQAAGTTRVSDVRFEDSPDEERVIVDLQGPIEYEGGTLTPTLQMLRLEDANLPDKLERSLDTSKFDGPVKTITSFHEGDAVKIIVATRDVVQPTLEEQAGKLIWKFPRSKSKGKSKVVSMAGTKVGGFATRRPSMLAAKQRSPRRRRGRERWRGERIDIEMQDAPIKDVLLLFSDIGRVNIIAGEGVEGTVTMRLTGVPWDQALHIILRSLNLGMVREGNVIRVATLQELEEERRKAIERAKAQVQLKPLETRLVPVSYATAREMIPKVQSVLSSRGSVTPDKRTNQLIIMDVAENISLAEQLVGQLDSQTPQVLIEARIVEARTNFLRQLGIQWGFGYTASPGTGNPTGLLFPNSLGVAGGATGRPPDTRGLILPGLAQNPNYAVDLPAPVGTGAGGALGFSFGNINGTLQTNLRLSAAEDVGEVRIISAPKIVTLDNTAAQIEQGVQIPISQVSAQGVNTRYVNATLALKVTPHVTNEGAVLLDVTVQKNEADFINTGARGDPTILTKQAESRMLVNDGDTAVIGGIYTRNKSVNFKKVPWVAEIPIIGWFFKNKSEADTRTEVLIFLTPKIVNRASSIGG